MNIRRSIVGAVLAGASLVGVAGMTSVAHAADPLEGSASAAAGDVTADQAAAAATSFKVKSWSDRKWVVSNVFATDGSGHNTGSAHSFLRIRTPPWEPSCRSEFDDRQRGWFVVGNSWISVLFHNRSNPKETLQLWFVRGFFTSHVDGNP